jgi:type I restriction enzyme R subunit
MPGHESFRRRDLPHWDVPGATCFVTTCVHNSIPARGRLDIQRYEAALARRPAPPGHNGDHWRNDRAKLVFARTDHWLDTEPAVRHSENPLLATVVVDALHFAAGERYDLLAYVVMPSHIHWVFRPRDEWVIGLADGAKERSPRERIVHSINRYTALERLRFLGRPGPFWQHESYDHWAATPGSWSGLSPTSRTTR